MTPKEQYEERRRLRKERRDSDARFQSESQKQSEELIEMADRFVTAVERIADALQPRTEIKMGGQPLFTAGMSENGIG